MRIASLVGSPIGIARSGTSAVDINQAHCSATQLRYTTYKALQQRGDMHSLLGIILRLFNQEMSRW